MKSEYPLKITSLVGVFSNHSDFMENLLEVYMWFFKRDMNNKYIETLCKSIPTFHVFINWVEKKIVSRLSINDLMAKPFQRITKYALLLKNIQKSALTLDDKNCVTALLENIEIICQQMDKSIGIFKDRQVVNRISKLCMSENMLCDISLNNDKSDRNKSENDSRKIDDKNSTRAVSRLLRNYPRFITSNETRVLKMILQDIRIKVDQEKMFHGLMLIFNDCVILGMEESDKNKIDKHTQIMNEKGNFCGCSVTAKVSPFRIVVPPLDLSSVKSYILEDVFGAPGQQNIKDRRSLVGSFGSGSLAGSFSIGNIPNLLSTNENNHDYDILLVHENRLKLPDRLVYVKIEGNEYNGYGGSKYGGNKYTHTRHEITRVVKLLNSLSDSYVNKL